MVKHLIDKQTLKHDAVREYMWGMLAYIKKQKIWFALVGFLFILAAGGIVGSITYNQYMLRQETIRFYKAEKIITKSGLEEKKAMAAAKKELKAFLTEYPEGKLSPVALMFLAKISWTEKDFDNVQKSYQRVLEHSYSGETTVHLATVGLAKLHESRGDFPAAVKLYESLPDKPYADLKAISLGRIALAQNQPKKARLQYEAVTKRFPPSKLAGMAQDAISILP